MEGGLILLAVDDEEMNLKLIEEISAEANLSFVGFPDPRSALNFSRDNEIDIAVIDYKMPGMNGIELIRELRRIRPEIPILMNTVMDKYDLMVEAIDAGATEFITKPINAVEFLARLRNLAGLRQSQRTIRALSAPAGPGSAEWALCRGALIAIGMKLSPELPQFRAADSARCIAQACGLSPAEADTFVCSFCFHDAGMATIPDSIVRKTEPLTQHERDALRDHTFNGRDALLTLDHPHLQRAAEIALTHHERFNGMGYPYGLAGEAIPYSGRIAAVVDVLDALCSPRFHRKENSFAEAWDLVISGSGSLFDPEVLAAAERVRAELAKIYN